MMPFFGRKKQDSSGKPPRPRSKFFDDQTDEQKISHSTKPKRDSKSKFYGDIVTTTSPPDAQNNVATTPNITGSSIASRNHALTMDLQGDLGEPNSNGKWAKRKSLLSPAFRDCLHDKELIAYFIQYMTSKNQGHLIKFWLAAENFYEASVNRIRSHSLLAASSTTTSSNEDGSSLSYQTMTRDDLQEKIKADAVHIYSRFIALDCNSAIGITEQLRSEAISKICSEGGVVDPLCFKECQNYIENILKEQHYKEFLESPFFSKYQIDILTTDRLQLQDVLFSENVMFYFMEFVEQENASTLLQFWMAVDNFQLQLEAEDSTYSGSDAQQDAMIIYEKYFSLQASEPLGFSDKVRMHVELNICREEGPLPDCFIIPKAIILDTIDKTLFQQFIRSQIYYRFLSELINSVHQATSQHGSGTPKLNQKIHHRTGSTSSFDAHSLGGHSTAESKMSASSSTSDVRSLRLNSDADDQPLWKRSHHMMSLGHLNKFGQYISELDLEPIPDLDKKKGNRFSRKKKEKEKAQEDMAWQIAKMIITDINSEVNREKPLLEQPEDAKSESTRL